MKRLFARLFATALLPALASPAFGQSCHSLSGDWVLDGTASKLGSGLSFNPYYKVDAINLTLDQRREAVHQSWNLKGAHIAETDRYTTPADGRAVPTNLSSRLNTIPIEVRGTWENCTLVEQARTNLFGQTIWTESRFIVSPNGRRLTIRQSSHSDLGDVERDLVFDRATGGAAR